MKEIKPIKRDEHLKPLSRDHHHSLLLCWKIRTGLDKEIPAERIYAYCRWFYRLYLSEHFQIEESYVFPVLGSEHPKVIKALEEHKTLSALFNEKDSSPALLINIAESLEAHIRFEERELFGEIQNTATDEELLKMAEMHGEKQFADNLNDVFWD